MPGTSQIDGTGVTGYKNYHPNLKLKSQADETGLLEQPEHIIVKIVH
jgi:hypothetical protein